MGYTGFQRRVAGIADNAQVGFRPGAVQVPGAADRTNDVVAALDDHRRDALQADVRRAATGRRASKKPPLTK